MIKIDLREQTFLPACIAALPVVQVVVSFNVFSFLQPVSLLVWALCMLCWAAVAVLYVRRQEMTSFGLLWALYFSWLTIATLLSATSFKSLSYIFVDCTLFLMLVCYYRHRLVEMLISCNLLFSALIYANMALMVLFPNWMFAAEDTFDSFILGGNYNQMGGRLLCGIVTSVLCTRLHRLWIVNAVLLTLASIATLALVGSMTALSGILVFGLFCLVPSLRLQKLGLVAFVVFYLLFQVFVCFSGEGLHNSELARYVIVDVLGKDITFTHRTTMWELASRLFAKSPLMGYGTVDSDWYIANMTSRAIGPHNFVWGQLVNGGVVLLTLLVTIMVVSIRRLMPCFDRHSCLLLMGLATLLFMMLMEVYPIFLVLYLLTLIYYYPELSRQCSQTAHETRPE